MGIIFAALIVMGVLGISFGLGLAYASRKFEVEVDPREQKVLAALPGINCGACGYPGCEAYAEAVALRGEEPDLCVPGGPETAKNVALVMGLSVEEKEAKRSVIHCKRKPEVKRMYAYTGINDCRAAALFHGGQYECYWACLGLGTCASVCPFDAITMENGLPVVDEVKCTGCGLCEEACPHNLCWVRPVSYLTHICCENLDKGKVANKICKASCIACGRCVKACPAEAIKIVDNLAQIDYERCTRCGACVDVCPHHCIFDFKKERLQKGLIKDEKNVEAIQAES
jgi:Na+-translocating ferredoxin:NAD+ oxidoreductase RNF subunit RnfB